MARILTEADIARESQPAAGETLVIENTPSEIREEDAGASLQIELQSPDAAEAAFVQLPSWDESGAHARLRGFLGRRLRVTVEALDP